MILGRAPEEERLRNFPLMPYRRHMERVWSELKGFQVMYIFEKTSAFLRIREHTCEEFVAVGSNEVLRWGESQGPEQLWMVIPNGDGTYRFLSRVDQGMPTPLYLTVAIVGDPAYLTVSPDLDTLTDAQLSSLQQFGITRENLKKCQAFRLHKDNSHGADDATFNIQESTKGEFVGVGSYRGKLVRWGRSGGDDQRFTFEPWRAPAPPPLRTSEAKPGEIGSAPEFEGPKPPAMSSPAKLIGETAVPAVIISDPRYPDKIRQFDAHPYYILRREQYWDRGGEWGYYRKHSKDESATETVTLTWEVTTVRERTIKETLSTELSITGGVAFGPVTAGFSTKISTELSTTEVSQESIKHKDTRSREIEYKQDHDCYFACYTLIDQYTLLEGDGDTVVQQWRAPIMNATEVKQYPSGSAMIDGSRAEGPSEQRF